MLGQAACGGQATEGMKIALYASFLLLLFLVVFLAVPHSFPDLSFPNQGWNSYPLQRELRVLTTGPPRESWSLSLLP